MDALTRLLEEEWDKPSLPEGGLPVSLLVCALWDDTCLLWLSRRLSIHESGPAPVRDVRFVPVPPGVTPCLPWPVLTPSVGDTTNCSPTLLGPASPPTLTEET